MEEERKIKRRKRKRLSPEASVMHTISAKIIIMAAIMIMFFAFLIFRTWTIMRDNGERYKKQVLNQQKYDSRSIPYQRGAILDRNGTLLAYSERVYNVILDAKMALRDPDSIEPTFNAVSTCLGIDTSVGSDLRDYMADNPESQYHVAGLITYEQRQEYETYIANYNATIAEENKNRDKKLPEINKKAIWFEDQFKRTYPGGTLACDVIGFTTSDGRGQYGLEEYYDDMLTGKNGREYGYLTAENALERTVVPAQNGYTLVTTIDSYVQRVCEEKLKEYDETHAGEYRENEMGADNTGVIVMDIHSGEILAMASYPYYNLNDPRDLSMYSDIEVGQLARIGGWNEEFVEGETSEERKEKEESRLEKARQTLWKNFCIAQSYEPGSVCKTFTVAAALDAGVIHDGDSFDCRGYLTFGEGSRATTIRCHQRYGDGVISLKQAVEKSCNVALMLIGQKLGKDKFLKYQRNFNFGLRTNIDLAGEMRTATLVFNKNNMGITELMTSTFGQGFNVTMIQNISAFASLVNGGYYYQPHVVKQIKDSAGAVVENIEPTIVRQAVSESVSRLMIDYCIGVVDEGTGTRARPAGYRIGGKTGTAERSGQGKRDYTVSFMGFAPANDPQIAIYVVVDRPNTASQENGTRNACILCKDILTEILPYLHIFMTEPLTAAERKELEEKGLKDTLSQNSISDSASENEVSAPVPVEEKPDVRVLIDDKTGYAIDPINGEYLDPDTGVPINDDSSIFQDANGNPVEIEVLKDEEEEKLDPRE